MREAPPGAVYVWPVARSREYAKALAEHLGRTDRYIVGPEWVRPENIYGLTRPVVIDHAAGWFFNLEQRYLLRERGLLN